MKITELHFSIITTPLGDMKAVGSDSFLYALEFVGSRANRATSKLELAGFAISRGSNKMIESIEKELNLYFSGELKNFKTLVFCLGTEFQKIVWNSLQSIPSGETWSYAQLAESIGNEKAFRAVANANGKNHLAIIIPCHRVINKNGKIGGYGGLSAEALAQSGGVDRKEWLLNHEKGMK